VRNFWLVLSILDLILVYGVYVRISRVFGRIVIADRYLLDTWIDFTLGFPEVCTDQWLTWKILNKTAPRPDVTFLLLIPVQESLKRSILKNEPFPNSEDVLKKRKELYINLSHKGKYVAPNCLQPIGVVQKTILKNVVKILD
jgi:thymidylate kinase